MGYAVIKLRRGTLYENSVNNVLLQEGEIILEAPDTGVGTGLSKFKIGDGVRRYRDLPYAFDGSSANSILGGNASEYALIQLRSDTSSNWKSLDPILAKNELAYDLTYKWFKIGDGVSSWNNLEWLGGRQFDLDKNLVDDYGDEDEIINNDVLLNGSASVVYRTATGQNNYADKLLPEGWDENIQTVELEPTPAAEVLRGKSQK